MATTLTSASIRASVSWQYDNALSGSITPTVQASFSYSKSLTNGTGAANTADLIYAAQTTLAGGATSNFDFAGSLTDFFGATITMARVKYLYIGLTTDTTASSISVGNATNPVSITNTATATIPIRNGGILLMGCGDATGIAVTGGATDTIKLANNDGSNTATVQICAIGSTA